jgi:SecD/SecF fusion protein
VALPVRSFREIRNAAYYSLEIPIPLILTTMAIVFVLPSFTGNLPPWWGKYISHGLNLGLDLKGGMHLILQVDMDKAVHNVLSRSATDLKEKAGKRGLELHVGDISGEGLPVSSPSPDIL